MQLEELVRRIRHGDKDAISELVATYGNAVYQRAFERTNDRELAREAARQTFGQFVAIVQQQKEEDGWSLWFGDLIERNIAAYAQIGVDMSYIESELENELYDGKSSEAQAISQSQSQALPKTQPAESSFQQDAPARAVVRDTRSAREEPAFSAERDRAVERERAADRERTADRTADRNRSTEREQPAEPDAPIRTVRDEVFDETPEPSGQKRSNRGLSVVLLILVSALLLWVVAGVAMTMKWIPYYDFGYSWFNASVFHLF